MLQSRASVTEWQAAYQVLDEEEKGRFFYYVLTNWNNLQNRWYQQEQGYDDPVGFEQLTRMTARRATVFYAMGLSREGESSLDEFIRKNTNM